MTKKISIFLFFTLCYFYFYHNSFADEKKIPDCIEISDVAVKLKDAELSNELMLKYLNQFECERKLVETSVFLKKHIILLNKNKLSPEVIVEIIKKNKFDRAVTTDEIINLSKSKIDEKIIVALTGVGKSEKKIEIAMPQTAGDGTLSDNKQIEKEEVKQPIVNIIVQSDEEKKEKENKPIELFSENYTKNAIFFDACYKTYGCGTYEEGKGEFMERGNECWYMNKAKEGKCPSGQVIDHRNTNICGDLRIERYEKWDVINYPLKQKAKGDFYKCIIERPKEEK